MPPYVGLACAAGLLALLLVVPVQVHLHLERERTLRARLRLVWLFGLVRLQPRLGRSEARRKEPPAGRRRGRVARRLAGGLVRTDLLARTLAFLRSLLRALRPRDVHVRARIGLDDPADTGMLWGLVGPLGVLLSGRDVRLGPGVRSRLSSIPGAGPPTGRSRTGAVPDPGLPSLPHPSCGRSSRGESVETLRATRPLRFPDRVLIPIACIRLESSRLLGGLRVHASMRPWAIVVGERGRWRAFDDDGSETALEPLLAEVDDSRKSWSPRAEADGPEAARSWAARRPSDERTSVRALTARAASATHHV